MTSRQASTGGAFLVKQHTVLVMWRAMCFWLVTGNWWLAQRGLEMQCILQESCKLQGFWAMLGPTMCIMTTPDLLPMALSPQLTTGMIRQSQSNQVT